MNALFTIWLFYYPYQILNFQIFLSGKSAFKSFCFILILVIMISIIQSIVAK